jgi:hypothetical protein
VPRRHYRRSKIGSAPKEPGRDERPSVLRLIRARRDADDSESPSPKPERGPAILPRSSRGRGPHPPSPPTPGSTYCRRPSMGRGTEVRRRRRCAGIPSSRRCRNTLWSARSRFGRRHSRDVRGCPHCRRSGRAEPRKQRRPRSEIRVGHGSEYSSRFRRNAKPQQDGAMIGPEDPGLDRSTVEAGWAAARRPQRRRPGPVTCRRRQSRCGYRGITTVSWQPSTTVNSEPAAADDTTSQAVGHS